MYYKCTGTARWDHKGARWLSWGMVKVVGGLLLVLSLLQLSLDEKIRWIKFSPSKESPSSVYLLLLLVTLDQDHESSFQDIWFWMKRSVIKVSQAYLSSTPLSQLRASAAAVISSTPHQFSIPLISSYFFVCQRVVLVGLIGVCKRALDHLTPSS